MPMPDEHRRAQRRAKAASLVEAAATEAEAGGGAAMSLIARQTLTDAVMQDLASNSAKVHEAFVAKVEIQTEVLTQAAGALTDATESLAAAVKAVKEDAAKQK